MYAEALLILAYCCGIGCAISFPLAADEMRKAEEGGGVDVCEGHGLESLFFAS